MAERLVVLGGWGVTPAVLRPVFGDDATYIDTTPLLPQLVISTALRNDWPDVVARALEPHCPAGCTIAGWSTGAMLAYGAAPFLAPSHLLLLSATCSFCRTSAFRHGMRQSIVAAMKERLKTDRQGVLDEFTANCGFTGQTNSDENRWSTAALADGLTWLEQAQLEPLPVPPCGISMLHGSRDRIIPPEAGKTMSSHCGADFTLLEGPHACFLDTGEIIRKKLTTT